MTDEFVGWKTGDATKDAVLLDAGQAQTAMNEAILKGTTDTPDMAFYYNGNALTPSVQWARKWLDAGLTYTGATRYCDPKVEIFGESSAGVSYCADESKAYNQVRKTGKVDRTPAGNEAYVRYDTPLEKSRTGVWQTSGGTSERGSRTCLQ
ncbi:hypothetical protein AB0912_07900 [Streptomyces sp. NPDC007084]|uniref:hypothetical protein n=1 Tax=Streptomyces sp. NPDC007084 TaxID=3154313 RepID=UPI0034548F77